MKLVIEKDMFGTKYPKILDVVDRLKLEHDYVRIFPFVDKVVKVDDIPESFDVEDITEYIPTGNIVVIGSVKLSRIAKNIWNKGTFLNDNHNYEVYSKYYLDELVNYDCNIVDFNHDSNIWSNEYMFLRPALDGKIFNGKFYSKVEWNEFVEYNIKNNKTNIDLMKQKVVVAPVKKIFEEVRFFVIKGKIISGSRYMYEGKFSPYKYYDDDAIIYAQKMIDIYQPADAFVIDVCLTDKGWKIVELNCFNSSGYYECDIEKILTEILSI